MSNIKNWEGTIAKVLNDRMNEIAPLMEFQGQFYALKNKIINVIQESDIKNEQDKQRAIIVFNRINNYHLLLSTLATYLTGIKVSWRDEKLN